MSTGMLLLLPLVILIVVVELCSREDGLVKVSESTIELVNSSCRGIDDMTGASRHGHVDFFVLLFLLAGGGKGCLASKFTGLAQRKSQRMQPTKELFRASLGEKDERWLLIGRKSYLKNGALGKGGKRNSARQSSTARQIREKEQNSSVRLQPVRCPGSIYDI